MTTVVTTSSEDEYLEAIYRLSDGPGPVPLSALADRLGFSAVSTNEMVKRMVEKGLLVYTPYAGASLTPNGRGRAEEILRRHRLWERFLTDVLGFPWDAVHEEACRLEHATSEQLEQRLAAFLDQPNTCPHGHPLPGGRAEAEATCLLSELGVGMQARITEVRSEDAGFLRALADNGLRPGVVVRVTGKEPALQTIRLASEDGERTIALSAAAQITVVPIHATEEPESCSEGGE